MFLMMHGESQTSSTVSGKRDAEALPEHVSSGLFSTLAAQGLLRKLLKMCGLLAE